MSLSVLGDYNIIKQIGQGSLGQVFLAEHRFMKKQYAIKVLPKSITADRNFINRFQEEVAVLSGLDHPNIVKVHNVSFSDGVYFLVCDCIVDDLGETTNLFQYLSEHKSSLLEEQLIDILYQLADALDYAHAKQIIHGGIKLNNILMGKNSQKVHVYWSDFGFGSIIGSGFVLTRIYRCLAEALNVSVGKPLKAAHEDPYEGISGEGDKLTKLHASFLQHYSFIAPEQRVHHPQKKVDYQSDLYSVGVLIYYILTRAFPMGVFEMPSSRVPHYKKNWDRLIFELLQNDPLKRPVTLKEALRNSLGAVEVFSLKDPLKEATGSYHVTSPITAKGVVREKITASEQIEGRIQGMQRHHQSLEKEHKAVQSPPVHSTVAIPANATGKEIKRFANKPIIHEPEIKRPTYEQDLLKSMLPDVPIVKHYNPGPKEYKNIEPIQTDMVVIQEGEGFRGSHHGNRDEMPRHKIYFSSFAIDIHPVTNEQFSRFIEAMGGEKDSHNNDMIKLKESRIKRVSGKLIIESGYSKHPVVGVTWYGAVAYAKWVGKRLPTEVEWEVACRAGLEDALFPYGEDIEKSQANFFSSDTTAVKSYPPNSYGLYDVVGNVYEWCQDWYDYNHYEVSAQEPQDPKGPLQGVYRVLRGGCWKSLKEDLRCSHRHRNNPGAVNRTYGFRCAADVE